MTRIVSKPAVRSDEDDVRGLGPGIPGTGVVERDETGVLFAEVGVRLLSFGSVVQATM